MLRRALPLLLLPGVMAAACGGGDGRSYDVDLPDDDYDLAAMQLVDADMPEEGIKAFVNDVYSNEDWAAIAVQQGLTTDAEQKRIQFEAQGRVSGYLSFFTWDDPFEHFGKIQSVESHSTLYKDVDSASEAISLRACGLLIADDKPLDPVEVPSLADESAGFTHSDEFIVAEQLSFGTSVETVVCFRTGRIVHAVVQSGLDGTQDLALAVEMARRKLEYVNAAFDGEDPPAPRDS